MIESNNFNHQKLSDIKTINDINALHADNELYSFSNGIKITSNMQLFILSVLRKEVVKLPKLSVDEWNDLFNILRIHGLMPYFYKQLTTRSYPVLLPNDFMENMKNEYLHSAMVSVVVESVLKDITSTFQREAIDVLVLKGPAFAVSLYDNPAMRPYTDLDLLVDLDDVPKSIELLLSLGYRPSEDMACSLEEKRYNQKSFLPYGSRKGPNLELHWNDQPFSMINEQADLKPIFNRAISLQMAGFSFKTMHPVDALCFAASHLIYQHDNELRLIWILDISLLCKSLKSPQEWTLLQKLCVENLSRIAVEKSIQMAKVWTDLSIPDCFDDFSKWPKPMKKETFFYSYQKTRNPIKGIQLALLSGEKNQNIASKAFNHAFPSPEFMRKRYPELKRWPLIMSYVRHWIYWFVHK